MSYRSGGARGSCYKMSEQNVEQITILIYIFETSSLDLRVQVSPFKHLVPSHTYESET